MKISAQRLPLLLKNPIEIYLYFFCFFPAGAFFCFYEFCKKYVNSSIPESYEFLGHATAASVGESVNNNFPVCEIMKVYKV